MPSGQLGPEGTRVFLTPSAFRQRFPPCRAVVESDTL